MRFMSNIVLSSAGMNVECYFSKGRHFYDSRFCMFLMDVGCIAFASNLHGLTSNCTMHTNISEVVRLRKRKSTGTNGSLIHGDVLLLHEALNIWRYCTVVDNSVDRVYVCSPDLGSLSHLLAQLSNIYSLRCRSGCAWISGACAS